jgi:hypothetical protein
VEGEMNMYRLWRAIVLALLVLPALSAAATQVLLAPAAINVTVADPFAVDVRVADAPGLYSFQFDLAFDPALMQLEAVLEGDFLIAGGAPTSFIAGTIDNTAGTLLFTANSLFGPGPGVSGDGVLARLLFKASAAGQGVLTLDKVLLLDAALNEIDAVSVNGAIDIALPSPVPEPPPVALAALALLVGWGWRQWLASRQSTIADGLHDLPRTLQVQSAGSTA